MGAFSSPLRVGRAGIIPAMVRCTAMRTTANVPPRNYFCLTFLHSRNASEKLADSLALDQLSSFDDFSMTDQTATDSPRHSKVSREVCQYSPCVSVPSIVSPSFIHNCLVCSACVKNRLIDISSPQLMTASPRTVSDGTPRVHLLRHAPRLSRGLLLMPHEPWRSCYSHLAT